MTATFKELCKNYYDAKESFENGVKNIIKKQIEPKIVEEDGSVLMLDELKQFIYSSDLNEEDVELQFIIQCISEHYKVPYLVSGKLPSGDDVKKVFFGIKSKQ